MLLRKASENSVVGGVLSLLVHGRAALEQIADGGDDDDAS
jgi:hypothetical protein